MSRVSHTSALPLSRLCIPSSRILHSRRNLRESSSSFLSIAWVLFFASESSVDASLLPHPPMLQEVCYVVRSDSESAAEAAPVAAAAAKGSCTGFLLRLRPDCGDGGHDYWNRSGKSKAPEVWEEYSILARDAGEGGCGGRLRRPRGVDDGWTGPRPGFSWVWSSDSHRLERLERGSRNAGLEADHGSKWQSDTRGDRCVGDCKQTPAAHERCRVAGLLKW